MNWGNKVNTYGVDKVEQYVVSKSLTEFRKAIVEGHFGKDFSLVKESIAEVRYFNLNRNLFTFDHYMTTIGTFIGTPTASIVSGVEAASILSRHYNGYYMGEYYYKSTNGDYTDFEPYSKCEIYLPYFGFTTLQIKDIYKKHIYFRLCLDLQSGTGVYYVYVSDISLDVILSNYWFNTSGLGNARLLATYSCNVGVQVPITTNGSDSRNRDTVLKLFRMGINTAVSLFMGGSRVTSAQTSISSITPQEYTVSSIPEGEKRRRITYKESMSGVTETRHTSRTVDYTQKDIFNECRNAAVDILTNFSTQSAHTNIADNSLFFNDAQKIHIIKRRVNIVPINDRYRHIYGEPLGTIKNMSQLQGYTKFTEFHLAPNDTNNRNDFGAISYEELTMINSIMTSGIYI